MNKLLRALPILLISNINVLLGYKTMNADNVIFWNTLVALIDLIYLIAIYINRDIWNK